MSDDVQTIENDGTTEEEKKTNRVYSQSEADQLVAKVLSKEREKYADYDTIKSEYQKTQDALREKELADKSELEKAQFTINELTTKLEGATGKLTEYQREKVRDGVLQDPKYSKMPAMYKRNVKFSDNLDEVRQSADEIYEHFKADFQDQASKTFGLPPDKKTDPAGEKVAGAENPEQIASQIRSRLNNLIRR